MEKWRSALKLYCRLMARGVADLEMQEEPTVAAGDSVTIEYGSQSFVGTVHRVSTFQGRGPDVRIVGGSGQLGTQLQPRQFVTPTAQNVVDAALREATEQLEATTLLNVPVRVLGAFNPNLGART